MGMGEKFKISVKFPKNAFNAIKSKTSANKGSNSDSNGPSTFLILLVLMIVVGLIIEYYKYSRNQDDGYQDYSGPVISSGRVRRGSQSHDRHDTGGSGGFGGRASSCACVSCDCACACACAGGGGGGAGCAKKWLHFCNRCDDPEYSDADAVKGKEEPGESK